MHKHGTFCFRGISFGSPNSGGGDDTTQKSLNYYVTNVNTIQGNLAKIENGNPFISTPHGQIYTVFTVQFANAKERDGGIKNNAGEILYRNGNSEETKFYKKGEQPTGWEVVEAKDPAGRWSEEYIVDLVDEPYSTEWWAKTNTQHVGGIVLKGDKRKIILANVSTTTAKKPLKENVWFNESGNRVTYGGRLLDVSGFKTLNFPSENADEDVILDIGIKGSVPGDPEMYRINMYQYWAVYRYDAKDSVKSKAAVNGLLLKQAVENYDEVLAELAEEYNKIHGEGNVLPSLPQIEDKVVRSIPLVGKERDLFKAAKQVAAQYENSENFLKSAAESGEVVPSLLGHTTFYDAYNGGPDGGAAQGSVGNPRFVTDGIALAGHDDDMIAQGGPIHQRLGKVAAGWDSVHNFQKVKVEPGDPPIPYKGGDDVPQWRLSKYFQEAPFKLNIEVSVPSDPSYKTVSSPDEVEGSNPPKGSWKHSFLEAYATIDKTKVLLHGKTQSETGLHR